MAKKIKLHLFVLLFLLMNLIVVFNVKAATPSTAKQRLNDITSGVFEQGDTNGDQFMIIIGIVINAFFSILGVIFIVLLLIAGYEYFMSDGNEAKAKGSITQIRNAIIGLIIIMGAFAIWHFVYNFLAAVRVGE